MPIYKTLITGPGGGGKPTAHKTPEAALAAFRALCERRTELPACAVLSEGNSIRKRYRIDAEMRGRRSLQDDPIIEGEATAAAPGRPAEYDGDTVRMTLRLSAVLHARLAASAAVRGVSLHQQIIDTLEGRA